MNLVRCLKCEKVLNCSRNDTACLLRHIEEDHPDVKLDNFKKNIEKRTPNKDINKKEIDNKAKHVKIRNSATKEAKSIEKSENVEEEKRNHENDQNELSSRLPNLRNTPTDILHRRYPPSTSSGTQNSVFRPSYNDNMIYRSSIANWQPGNGCIYCPKCGYCERPIIEDCPENCSTHEYWSSCILSCWPLCYLPCIKSCSREYLLYCQHCKNFLALYDRNSNSIRINPDYNANDRTQENTNHIKDEESRNLLPNQQHRMQQHQETIELNSKDHLPHIVIDGKELHPDMVRRLQKYKKYGALVGIDLEAVKDVPQQEQSTKNTNTIANAVAKVH